MKKVDRLEIENKILRESLEQIRQAVEKFDQIPFTERYTTEHMIGCIVSARYYSDYKERLEKELKREGKKRFHIKMREEMEKSQRQTEEGGGQSDYKRL
ncbi:MAG: hypothetical protein HFG70_04935 [Hungatella sp.]|nr:hypothetical protein [Hungatella sp.]